MVDLHAAAFAPGAGEALRQLRLGGRLLARFERVATLESEGGRLLALHGASVPWTPFSLVIAGSPPPGSGWPVAGAPCWIERQVLHAGSLRISLTGAVPIRPYAFSPRHLPGDLTPALRLLAPLAERSALWPRDAAAPAGQPSLDEAARRTAARSLEALVDAAGAAVPRAGLQEAALALVGLGPGATPSGDDLLAGFLGSWQRLGPRPDVARAAAARAAAAAPQRTTRLAAEFYYHLARGRLSQQLDALLAAIAHCRWADAGAAAERLACFGATSGCDTLLGVYLFLSARPAASRTAPAVAREHPGIARREPTGTSTFSCSPGLSRDPPVGEPGVQALAPGCGTELGTICP